MAAPRKHRKAPGATARAERRRSVEREGEAKALLAAPALDDAPALRIPRRVTRGWVLARLAENARRAMQGEPVLLRGLPTGEYRYDGSVVNRALELLGKELGLFRERQENSDLCHVISDQPLSEEEWEKRYSAPDHRGVAAPARPAEGAGRLLARRGVLRGRQGRRQDGRDAGEVDPEG